MVAAVYLAVTGINGYIKASKHIFDELNASKYGISKKDIFLPSSLSSKTGKAIRDSLKVNVTDDNFPSCATNNKCHWFYTPEKAEELSIQEFGKDFVSTMKSLKDLFTGEMIQQKLPNTLESGKKRSFSRTTANPSEMENLAKLSKSVEAIICAIKHMIFKSADTKFPMISLACIVSINSELSIESDGIFSSNFFQIY